MTDDIQVLALFVIKKGSTFSNTYGLCRMLSVKFQLSDCKEIIALLVANGYVNVRETGQINYYDITTEGKKFMDSKRNEAAMALIKEFPIETEAINILLEIN